MSANNGDGTQLESVTAQLRSYFVSACDFADSSLSPEDFRREGRVGKVAGRDKVRSELRRDALELRPVTVGIYTSPPGVSLKSGPQYEQRIDNQYLDVSTPEKGRLDSPRFPSRA
jgi:hypothetical protein